MRRLPIHLVVLALLLGGCGPVEVVQEDSAIAVARPAEPDPRPPPPVGGGQPLGSVPVLGAGTAHQVTFRDEGGWSCVTWDDGGESCSQGPYIEPREGTYLLTRGGQGTEVETCGEWVSSPDVATIAFVTSDGTRWKIPPLVNSQRLLGGHLFAACVIGQDFLDTLAVVGLDADGNQIAEAR